MAFKTKKKELMKTAVLAGAFAAASMLTLTSCNETETKSASKVEIFIDQCGYFPKSPKAALINGKAKNFKLINDNGDIVYEGKAAAAQYYAESDQTYKKMDFSDLQTAGTYTLVVDDTIKSMPIHIGANVYDDVATKAVKAFYYNRASMEIKEEFGGKWARKAGHPDTNVLVHKSAASAARPEGTVISGPGGWYDAGDYNKYIVNSGISTYTMLLTTKLYEKKAVSTSLNIPETGNLLPDILDETLYNLRWMLTMQDPNDGGVYHKLTVLSFEDFIMPDQCQKQRYVVAKGTAAALDFAATMAFASRMLPHYDEAGEMKALADSCIKAATKAYNWARKNPDVKFRNPEDVSTGEYGDWMLTDEWFWAANEMWLTTKDAQYAKDAEAHKVKMTIPTWGDVGSLGYISMALEGSGMNETAAKEKVLTLADSLLVNESVSPIYLSMQSYEWGSNSTVANCGLVKMIAYRLTGDEKYFNSAQNDLHYILGRNPLGVCFVTGVGVKSTRNPHHRPSAADGIDDPVPGFLSGGPNIAVMTDCGDDTSNRSQYPAISYADETCSYSTNEIAINWNAPLVFLTWSISEM